MIEWVTKYWLEVVFTAIVAGLSGAFAILRERVKCQKQEQNALKLGIQALLRDRIIHTYNKYMELGYIPIYALENVDSMYAQYHNLGGNGTITTLVKKLKELPSEPPKHEQN